MAKVGAALLLGRIRLLDEAACIDNNMMGLVVAQNDHNLAYWRYALSLIRFDLLANPGAVPSLNEGQVGNTRLPYPPLEAQAAIAGFLGRETRKMESLLAEAERAIALLQERRTALISAAVTGKIDVRGLAEAG